MVSSQQQSSAVIASMRTEYFYVLFSCQFFSFFSQISSQVVLFAFVLTLLFIPVMCLSKHTVTLSALLAAHKPVLTELSVLKFTAVSHVRVSGLKAQLSNSHEAGSCCSWPTGLDLGSPFEKMLSDCWLEKNYALLPWASFPHFLIHCFVYLSNTAALHSLSFIFCPHVISFYFSCSEFPRKVYVPNKLHLHLHHLQNPAPLRSADLCVTQVIHLYAIQYIYPSREYLILFS